MALILVACDKGGVGKTTTAVNIAGYLALEERDVMLFDADNTRDRRERGEGEGDASTWLSDRAQQPHVPLIHHGQGVGKIERPLRSLKGRYQDIVVDTGARYSTEMESALRVVDLVVIPVLAGQWDVNAACRMAGIVEDARIHNEALRALVVINRASNNWASTRAQQARTVLSNYPQLTLSSAAIRNSEPLDDAGSDGLSVFEGGRSLRKAADDFAALMHDVLSLLPDHFPRLVIEQRTPHANP